MADYGSPLVPRRRLAAELARLRKDSGLTGAQVAKQLNWSTSKVSRYELARTGLKPDDVDILLDFYRIDGKAKEELLTLATEAAKRGWWEAYSDVLPDELAELIGLETEARLALTWQIECIPGLLQTENYASQVNRGFQEVVAMPPRAMARRVKARLLRQQVLTRDNPLCLSVVIDESALLRGPADPRVMRDQMEHLVEVSALPNVTIHVLPISGSLAIIQPSFVVLEFGDSEIGSADNLPDVAYAEHLVTNLYFEEEDDTYHYKEAYGHLAAAALSEADSTAMFAELAKRI
ncbi:MAG TPA: helix-turn-helix transcriptional regulator [Streptosporangiaceae bacterium]|nr:helix-turn-helix transcriptional regulator [Streptosporangiaceae bacterium]